ncbi:MAG: protein O-mannosyl-transferase family, partial [Planctomycetota bacterium]
MITTVLSFAIAMAVLVPRTAPGLTFEDAGELASAAVVLGVPHPPGYPLWTLLGHLVVRLGSIFEIDPARALTLLSAVAAGCCCAGLAAFVRSRGASSLVAIGAGLVPLASATFLSQALIVEVYALASAFQAWLLFAALGSTPRPRTAWLLLGLGLAAHPASLLLAPLAPIATWRARVSGAIRPPALVQQALGLLAGLALYLYVPWSASRDPAMNWGSPTGGKRLLDHWLRRQYAGGGDVPFAPRLEFAAEQLVGAWVWLIAPLLVLALLGAGRVVHGCGLRRWLLLVVAVASVGGFVALPFDLTPEILRYRVAATYLPAVLAIAAFAGLGLAA